MFAVELYRRGIVLPLTKVALNRIREDNVEERMEVEWIKLNDDDLFYRICDTGVFSFFNRICSSFVDEYEEDEVEENLKEAGERMVSEFTSREIDSDVIDFIRLFSRLCLRAHRIQMPLVFIL